MHQFRVILFICFSNFLVGFCSFGSTQTALFQANSKDSAAALEQLVITFEELNIVDSAIFYCDEAIKLYRKNQQFDDLSRSYSKMHNLLRWSLGESSERTFILDNLMDSALTNALRSKNLELIAETLISKGMYIHNYDYESGLSFINRALDTLRRDDKFNPTIFHGLYQRGVIYYDYDQLDLAAVDFKRCMDLINSNNILNQFRSGVHTQLGRLYNKTGQYRQALDHLNIAYLIEKSRTDAVSFGIHSTLAMIYNKTNQKDSCIYFLNEQIKGLYEKINQNSIIQIAESGARFQISEHNEKIEELSDENKRKDIRNKSQQRFIVSLIMSIVLITILTIILYRQYRKTRLAYQSIQNKNGRIARQEKEIAILKAQQRDTLTNRFGHDLELLEKFMGVDKIFLDPDLSLSKVANLLKINHSYLSSIVNRHFGSNFTHYLNQYRINEAAQLLDSGRHQKYSIDAISKMVGFKSKSAFYRAFRQHKSCTPTEYLNTKRSTEK